MFCSVVFCCVLLCSVVFCCVMFCYGLFTCRTTLFADCSTAVAKSISQAEKKDKNLTGLRSVHIFVVVWVQNYPTHIGSVLVCCGVVVLWYCSSLVYGEVLFSSLARVVCKHIPVKPGMIFYDVGSGSGYVRFCCFHYHSLRCTTDRSDVLGWCYVMLCYVMLCYVML